MILPTPITLTYPAHTDAKGVVTPAKTVTLNDLKITVIDKEHHKTADVRFNRTSTHLNLWEGAAYEAVGDYTQQQVEARVLELLGENPQATLQALVDSFPAK